MVAKQCHPKKIFEINDLIIGDSESMAEIKSLVSTYSKSDASVLIAGATGTGKELVSKAIHLKLS